MSKVLPDPSFEAPSTVDDASSVDRHNMTSSHVVLIHPSSSEELVPINVLALSPPTGLNSLSEKTKKIITINTSLDDETFMLGIYAALMLRRGLGCHRIPPEVSV